MSQRAPKKAEPVNHAANLRAAADEIDKLTTKANKYQAMFDNLVRCPCGGWFEKLEDGKCPSCRKVEELTAKLEAQ